MVINLAYSEVAVASDHSSNTIELNVSLAVYATYGSVQTQNYMSQFNTRLSNVSVCTLSPR